MQLNRRLVKIKDEPTYHVGWIHVSCMLHSETIIFIKNDCLDCWKSTVRERDRDLIKRRDLQVWHTKSGSHEQTQRIETTRDVHEDKPIDMPILSLASISIVLSRRSELHP